MMQDDVLVLGKEPANEGSNMTSGRGKKEEEEVADDHDVKEEMADEDDVKDKEATRGG